MNSSKTEYRQSMYRRFTSKYFQFFAAVCLASLAASHAASAQSRADSPHARTESGRVVGTTVNGIHEFLGIPYAAPPVGNLRWMPPQPYGRFPGNALQATQFGNMCPQPGVTSGSSEDCLFLNIFTPQQATGDDRDSRDWSGEGEDAGRGHEWGMEGDRRHHGLPVMLWIHGGALEVGTGASYDPTKLVQQGVIVVTINYRLGYLGFFAQSAIDAEGHLNGNYGYMDQQFALQWVRRNIAHFGGDPDRVTIFGQSAGGQSVLAEIASPLAAGLFQGAISESGAYGEFQDYYDYIITLAQGETAGSTGVAAVPSGAAIANAVGCTNQTSACLRAVPASALNALEPPLAIFPFVDGKLLPQTMTAAFTSGAFNHVPVLTGTNHDEWRYYVALEYDFQGHPIETSSEYDAAVTALEGPTLEPTLINLYPLSDYQYDGEAMGALGTDGVFSCPARKAERALSQYVPTYAYEFNDENAPTLTLVASGVLTTSFPLGTYHASELQYLFNLKEIAPPPGGMPDGQLSPEQVQLSDTMIRYWTQFAKTGNPNSPDQPAWPQYNASTSEVQSLVTPAPVVETNFDAEHQCSTFWDTF